MRMSIAGNLKAVNELLTAAHEASPFASLALPRLVAVSKTKPVDDILEAYRAGHRHFGENYVEELMEKSVDERILAECPEIRWHYIGAIQSNKANKIAKIQNLFMVETVESEKVAANLQRAMTREENLDRLKVLVQVNTSGEDKKNGVSPEQAPVLSKFITEKCDRLDFRGFMTIGSLQHSQEAGDGKENPDFTMLKSVRAAFASDVGLLENDLELSMGMSTDFEAAVKAGSTNVRVGSAIFGARNYKTKS